MNFRNLFTVIKQSIYGPRFYAHVVAALPLKESIRYFYTLVLILSVIVALIMGAVLIPTMQYYLRGILGGVASSYPDDLVITFKDGMASVNESENRTTLLPEAMKPLFEGTGHPVPVNLLVVDTEASTSTPRERFEATSTAFLLTRDALLYEDEHGIAIQGLADIPNTTVTKERVVSLNDKLARVGRWLSPLVIFGLFIAFLVIYSFTLLYLFFGALVVYLIARIKKIRLTYRTAYRVAIHLSTLALLMYTFVTPFTSLPFGAFVTFTLVLAVLGWLNLDPKLIATVSKVMGEAPKDKKPEPPAETKKA